MDKQEILDIVEEYVKKVCKDEPTGHDWWHVERVYNTAMLINEKEKADQFIITMIVYMHDLYDHKFYNGNIEEALERTLKELNIYERLSKKDIENIIYSCVNLGFTANIVTRKELSKEGQIAQDADRLDAMGAMGIARTFAYGGKVGRPIYVPNSDGTVNENEYVQNGSRSSIKHFYDKLLKIKELMNTETAKKIAEKRHEYSELFLEEFFDEWNGKK